MNDSQKIIAIIQARMGSTRLPGKILKVVNGKTLLEYQLERVKQSRKIDQIIIATTVEDADQPIIDFCEEYGIKYYRGSENDVLSRYYETAQKYDADIIVRLTSDCPIIDPIIIDKTIQHYLDNSLIFDYVSNTVERTFPRGLDTEVFSLNALKKAYEAATLARDREHVTAYLYTNPEIFRIGHLTNKKDYGNNRWTVDTLEDFRLIDLILTELYQPNKMFYMEDIINLLEKHPDWVKLNAHIEQKKI
ncbi:glycosyltransferase family protein [Bacillus sp. Cr_A10]|uniref:glycosyltransferase family protein n=1 Tax=Bacillus sp. Cr_A10 TaxID=3033993 RepID=UPI0023DBC933|nr:glycosyltransferase family protein [Bacillus sp. Cr_A10]MDF2065816.1 glycosyltransferase family protein [Bacillus sp. Cr_A10]